MVRRGLVLVISFHARVVVTTQGLYPLLKIDNDLCFSTLK